MRLTFVPDLTGSAWTGPPPDARFGEAWVGPRALLQAFETALGLGGPYPAEPVRAYGLVRAIGETEGFWSESATADPLAVARTLLSWRDELWLHGWAGRPLTPRLAELAAVTAEVTVGLPDRIAQARDTLRHRRPALEAIRLVEPCEGLPRLWRELLLAAGEAGVRLAEALPIPAPAAGDLAAARRPGFAPRGDDSLQLVRPAGPLEAADEVAGWLAAQPDLEESVIIGPDSVLDRALHRHGLPTTSAPDPHDNVLLQLLPLLLALGWSPPDPVRALELATLPVSPLPRRLAQRLAESLHRWPAVGSDAWDAALRDGLGAIDDPTQRARVTERLGVLLAPCSSGDEYPAAAARQRVGVLQTWLRARCEREPDLEREPWEAALIQCERFLLLLDASGLTQITRPSMHRLLEEAARTAPSLARHSDEAGLRWVSEPSALVGPARRVVWWSFERRLASAYRRLPLSPSERHALAAAGCPLPDPGQEALRLAARWRRPLLQSTEQLLLVCPEIGADGDAAFPHPLWDELLGGLAEGASAGPLRHTQPRSQVTPMRAARPALTLPGPRRDWHVAPELLHPLERESPTSLGTLLGCSFHWAARYMGQILGGVTTALPAAERLLGSVVHEVLSRVLKMPGPLTPAEAAEEAARLFASEGPRMAAAVFWPGAEPVRNTAARVIRDAAEALFRQIESAGLEVVLVETEVETTALGRRLRGRPDVVLGEPAAIVDLKWGGATYRRDQLRAGTAYQLATYAHLLRAPTAEAYPAAAYFILREQRLLTATPWAFPEGEHLDGADTRATWLALERAQDKAWAVLADGSLSAPANPDSFGSVVVPEDRVRDGAMELAPPCRFCELDALCGKRFGAGS